MALSRRSRNANSINIWPGFVDALTQLVMVIVFVLLVFTVGQFYLSGAVSSQDLTIKDLTKKLNQLSEMLGLERKSNDELKATRATLNAQLAAANDKAAQADAANQDKQRQLTEEDA